MKESSPDFIIIPLKYQEQYRCPGCGQYRPTEYGGDLECPFCNAILRCEVR